MATPGASSNPRLDAKARREYGHVPSEVESQPGLQQPRLADEGDIPDDGGVRIELPDVNLFEPSRCSSNSRSRSVSLSITAAPAFSGAPLSSPAASSSSSSSYSSSASSSPSPSDNDEAQEQEQKQEGKEEEGKGGTQTKARKATLVHKPPGRTRSRLQKQRGKKNLGVRRNQQRPRRPHHIGHRGLRVGTTNKTAIAIDRRSKPIRHVVRAFGNQRKQAIVGKRRGCCEATPTFINVRVINTRLLSYLQVRALNARCDTSGISLSFV